MNVSKRLFALRKYALAIIAAFTLFTGFHALRLDWTAASNVEFVRGATMMRAAHAFDDRLLTPDRLTIVVMAEHGTLRSGPAADRLNALANAMAQAIGSAERGVEIAVSDDGRTALVSGTHAGSSVELAVLRSAILEFNDDDAESGLRAELLPDASERTSFEDARLPLIILCLVSVFVIAAGLLLQSGSFVFTALVWISAALAVVWTLGLWRLIGGTLDPDLALIPFFIFVLGLTQGFAISRPLIRSLAREADAADAASAAFAQAGPPIFAALLGSAFGVLAIGLVEVPLAGRTALLGAIGVATLIPAMLLACPLALASIPVDRPPPLVRPRIPVAQPRTPSAPPVLADRRIREVGIILLAAFSLIAALEARQRPVGQSEAAGMLLAHGPPRTEARPSPAGQEGGHLDTLVILAKTRVQGCMDFRILDYIDRLSWRLSNEPGVAAVESISFAVRKTAADAHEGNPRWQVIPRNTPALIEAIGRLTADGELFDSACAVMPIRIRVERIDVLDQVRAAVARFARDNPSNQLDLTIAEGAITESAAANANIRAREPAMIFCMIVAFLVPAFVVLRDWRAVPAVVLGVLLPLLGIYWCMGLRGLGLDPETMPLVVFALVLTFDFAIHLTTARLRLSISPPSAAWRQALTEEVPIQGAKAVAIALAFGLWLYAPTRLQTETGLLILVAAGVSALFALGALPALVVQMEEMFSRKLGRQRPTPAPLQEGHPSA